MKHWCQCEHYSHCETDKKILTPNGNYAHKYGQQFEKLVPVKTVMGTFNVCEDCAKDCYSPERMARLMDPM